MTNKGALLNIDNMTIAFGGLKAIDDVTIHVNEGEFVGLIGPNGAGKTTFFNAITGNVKPTSGTIIFNEIDLSKKKPDQISNCGISRTFQNIRIFPKMTVLENVMIPMHGVPSYSMWEAMLGLPVVKRTRVENEERAETFLKDLGLETYRDREAGTLAYGLQRRLEIARALAASPKLLLLDEPAAGMNNDECDELVDLLKRIHKQYNLTIVLIEHHISFVLKLCSRIYVLNLGKLLAEGGPSDIQNNPEVIKAYLGDRRRKK